MRAVLAAAFVVREALHLFESTVAVGVASAPEAAVIFVAGSRLLRIDRTTHEVEAVERPQKPLGFAAGELHLFVFRAVFLPERRRGDPPDVTILIARQQ